MRRLAWLLFTVGVGAAEHAKGQWSTGMLPLGRTDFAAAASARALYVAGGSHLWTMLDSVDVQDLATGAWSQLQMSTPRKYHAVAAAGDEVFFAGGWPWFDNSLGALDTVDIYNEATGSWTLEHLPHPAAMLSAGVLGDKVYFAGGGDPVFRNIIQVFDTTLRTWSVLHVPGPGRGLQMVASSERWLCFGADGGYSQRIDVLDGLTGNWSHLVAPDIMVTMALAGDRLFMTGCMPGLAEHALFEYDLLLGTWSMLRRPTDRCGPLSAAVGPFVIFANGHSTYGPSHHDAEVYNGLTGEWATSPISVAARGRVVVPDPANGRIFVIGGYISNSPVYIIRDIDVFHSFPSLGSEFCSASINSTGASARIWAAGLASSEDDWFHLGIEGGPEGAAAMILVSQTSSQGTSLPGSQGALCLAGTVTRLGSTLGRVSAGGSYGAHLDLTLPTSPPQAIGVGETWHFQCWYRDANPGPTSNLSTALTVSFN
ncbi:MAG: hypothetical protein R3F49_24275 [Planctomycetota bacterium]